MPGPVTRPFPPPHRPNDRASVPPRGDDALRRDDPVVAGSVAGRKPVWRRALAWGVGLGLLGWLLHKVPASELWVAVQRPAGWVWGTTLLGLMLSYLMRAARLQVVMGLSAHTGRRWMGLRMDALRVILMHNAAVNLLPMRAGEASFPWLASRELGMPLAQSVACLLWMRLQDLAVLLGLGLLAWPGLPAAWRGLGLAGLVAGWWLGLWLLAAVHRRTLARSGAPAPTAGWRSWLHRLHGALLAPHHHGTLAWGFTLANWAIKLTAGALLLSQIMATPMTSGWAGALGGELAAVVPVQGPAGFGTYEAGVWAGVALSWPSGSPQLTLAVPAALALHTCFLVCAVLAGALSWAMSSRADPAPSRIPD